MTKMTKPSLKDPEIVFLTFFGSGLSPWAPGTMGSLAILVPLYILGQLNPPFFLFLPFITILCVGSLYMINRVEKKMGLHDPQWIVIDEVVGMWIATLFLQNNSLTHFLMAFIWFRVFDIFKPWPINYFDNMNNSFGTLFDDVVAGLLAGGLYLLTLHAAALLQ